MPMRPRSREERQQLLALVDDVLKEGIQPVSAPVQG
jgi:hypothetical protein